jgi:hypothetical protein
MTQIAFGVTQGPNGPQMTTMFIPTPSAPEQPESYESHLETPEGVHVRLTYFTSNKVSADRYADEAASKLGWKVLEQAPPAPTTLMGKIGEAWLGALLIPVALVFVAFIVAFVFHMAGYLTFRDLEAVGSLAVRVGLWSFLPLGFVLTCVAIITHSSAKVHDSSQ